MPTQSHSTRDYSESTFFAEWVAEEDHFASPAKPKQARPQESTQRASAVRPVPRPRDFADASTQTAVQALPAPQPSAAPQPAQEAAPQPEETLRSQLAAPTPSGFPVSSHPPAAARARSATQARRTRDQVTRDSYQLLWREYLALTSAEAEEQQRRQQQRRANSFSLSRIASVFGGAPTAAAAAHRSIPDSAASEAPAAMASTTTAPAATILQGPLDYTRPKGLDKIALLVLCPPSDLLDMQRLTKLAAKLFTLLCKLLVTLSFLVIPAWLWLVRHEYAIGHIGDAVVVGVAGVLLFLAADAINKAAASSAAAAKAGVFTASQRSAYQSSPGYVASVAAAAAPASAAAHPAAAPRAAPGAVAHRSVPAYAASSHDPAVRQVKQRIMKLERLLFGNELTEADIGPDMLQGRVQALCLEVGVPFGGHGRSSSHMSAGELDAQLQAVEKALGI